MDGAKTEDQKHRGSIHAMRNLHMALVVFLLLAQGVHPQRVKLNRGKPSSRTYHSTVEYRDIRGKIIIPVEIEGKTYQFLFDTGAPNLISKDLSDRISTKSLNSIKVRDANDSSREMEVVALPSIKVGTVEFEGVPTIVNSADSSFILDCFELDGIVGSNMMRRSVVHIDSQKKLLTVTNDPGHFNVSEQEGIDLSLSEGQSSPYLWIRLKGEKKAREYVLFDTGMQGFYDMSLGNYEKLRELGAFSVSESGEGTKSIGLFNTSESRVHHRVTIPEIEIGEFGFQNVKTVTMDADRSRIGSEILQYGKITLDYKNARFYFQPYSESRDLQERSLGFSPTILEGEVVVGIVWFEELKERLNYGDRILSVNGMRISGEDACDFMSQPSPFDSDGIFRIRFRDGETGDEFELEMRKE